MVTSVGPNCGIAAYTRELVGALSQLVQVNVLPIEIGKQPVEHYVQQAETLNDADVIHVQHEHSFWGGILPGHSAFWEFRYLLKKPLVITAHTTTSLSAMLRLKQERRPHIKLAKYYLTLKKRYRDSIEIAPFVTGRCIVHTEEGRRDLIERGANPEYVHTIPAGVPDPLPAPSGGASFRQRFNLEDRPVITLFGYTSPNKGYELVLEAMPLIPAPTILVIAGGPRNPDTAVYLESLRARIATSGVGERVVYTGFLSDEDLAEAMAASDLALTPHTEATGSYSVMFPLTYGRPVVASDLAIFREIKERGGGVELFPNRDSIAFARIVNELLQDAGRRESLSRQAFEYAREHRWPAVARRTVEIYRLAVEDARRHVQLA